MHKIVDKKPVSASRLELTRRMGHHVAVELSETAKLAWPMALTQIGQIVMMTTDLAFIGHIGAEAIAVAALAGRVYVLAFTFGTGLLAPIAPLAAQAFEANNPTVVRRALRMGLWVAMVLAFPRCVLRRANTASFRPGVRHGAARPEIFVRTRLGRDSGTGFYGYPQFHGRGQPAGADRVDHACSHPRRRPAGLRSGVPARSAPDRVSGLVPSGESSG
ncbi:MATE family efflux transporter [Bradyrhizobium murdochi]|uniref:MATE family efflux transporter n=1 Tax=Bradyrhizobium murdochi TaxID=1038859 RepID=UPI003D31A8CE